MNKKKILSFILLFNFVILQSHLAVVMAQTTDEDVAESERQKTIAENKKAEIEALFPKPDVASLVGTTVTEGSFIESQMLGYCAMKSAATGIVGKVSSFPNNSSFVFYNEDDVKMLSRYKLMLTRLEFIENGYREIAPDDPDVRILGGAGLAINTALNFLSLLKTDIKITGTDVNIGEKELVAEVFGQLHDKGKGYKLYYTKTIPMGLCNDANFENCSPLFKQIIEVVAAYEDARIANLDPVNDKEKISLREQLNTAFFLVMKELGLPLEPSKPTPTPAPMQNQNQNQNQNPTPTPIQNSQTTTVTVNVGDKKEESGGGGGNTSFISYLQAESLFKVITEKDANGKYTSFWIDMQVVKAGGNMRVRTNFITNFFIGSRVNFSGGAIVYFNVFDYDGAARTSGVFQSYQKYLKSSQINATCNKGDK